MKIKDAFEAQPGYILVEVDYAQMEVAGLAACSRDTTLIREIQEGVDLHTRNAAAWRKCREDQVSKKDRKTAKIMTFQLAYGASAKRMAKDFGLPLRETEAFIASFCEKYTGVDKYWTALDEDVNSRIQIRPSGVMGEPVYSSELVTDYGKCYTFMATDTKRDWKTRKQTRGVGLRFIKNYPVQGVTADLLKMAQASLWRARDALLAHGAVPLVPIHDALYFKFSEDMALDALIELLEYHMTKVPVQTLNRLAGWEWWPTDLPLRIDVKTGRKWSEMTEYNPT